MDDSVVSFPRRRRYEWQEQILDNNKTEKRTKTNAERQREYRERIKSNPEYYESVRKFERERLQTFRLQMTEEQKQRYNEKAKLRNQKYRERLKEKGISKTSKKISTRKATEDQRKSWRDNKRNQREGLSTQKKRRINEKRRRLYALKKDLKNKTNYFNASDDVIKSSENSGYQTNAAKRKAISRSLRVLPKSPSKFAEVIANVVEKSTPRKKRELQKKMIYSPRFKRRLDYLESTCSAFNEKLKELKKKRKTKDNHLRRLIHDAVIAKGKISKIVGKTLGLSQKLLKKAEDTSCLADMERKIRKDALTDDVKQTVSDYYNMMHVSKEMPIKKTVKFGAQKVLENSLRYSYDKFCQENSNIKLSYSKFVELRPKNIRPMTQNKYMQCLCEYCINLDFKLRSMKLFCINKNLENIVADKYELSRITLCPKIDGYYKKDCIDRNCDMCGLKKLDDKMTHLQEYSEDAIIWKKWQLEDKNTGGNRNSKFMTLGTVNGKFSDFVVEFREELTPFSKHIFNAQWQAKEFEYLKVNIPQNWVLMCMDFAQNYCCRHQVEAQSAHWQYN